MYLFSLEGKDACVFDQKVFDDLESGKEWSKGRQQYYCIYTQSFYKYAVVISKRVDHPQFKWIPFDSYLEE